MRKRDFVLSAGMYLLFFCVVIPLLGYLAQERREKSMEGKIFPEAIAYLDTVERDVRLYTEFSEGQYFQFYGYKTYMDARPELYMERINGVEDIYIELCSVTDGEEDFPEFIEKYRFTHIETRNNGALGIYLRYAAGYRPVAKDGDYILYERINP